MIRWRSDGALTYSDFLNWVDRGAVVIFDGLDEVLVKLPPADGKIFTQRLLGFYGDSVTRQARQGKSQLAPKILISCRTQFYETLRDQQAYLTGSGREDVKAKQFKTLTLLPFTDDQVETYLAAALPGGGIDKIKELVASVYDLTELTHRPVLLNIVREIIPALEDRRARGEPIYGVTLYEELVDSWLERDHGKHKINEFDKVDLMADIAAGLWENAKSHLPIRDIERLMWAWFGRHPEIELPYSRVNPQVLEEDLRTATFLTRLDDPKKPKSSTFRFAHTSLQEYFLAVYLRDGVKRDDRLTWSMRCPSQEALVFLTQLIVEENDEALTKRLTEWAKGDAVDLNTVILMYSVEAHRQGWPTPSLEGINLSGADLTNARIGVRGGVTEMEYLDLSGAKFQGSVLNDAHFRRVNLDGAHFGDAKCGNNGWYFQEDAWMFDCSLQGANWANTEFKDGTLFVNCDLRNGVFGKDSNIPWYVDCEGAPVDFKVADDPSDAIALRQVEAAREAIISGKVGGDGLQIGQYVWRFLRRKTDEEGDWALLLSEHVVNLRPYHSKAESITWSESSLRKWLNSDFYNGLPAIFRQSIVESDVDNPDNDRYGERIPGGPNTRDKVFLLSLDDVDPKEETEERLFKDRHDLIAGRHDGKAAWWWLRSPGPTPRPAAVVGPGGGVNVGGGRVADYGVAVRPALWFNLES
jgi:hypothetical protein